MIIGKDLDLNLLINLGGFDLVDGAVADDGDMGPFLFMSLV